MSILVGVGAGGGVEMIAPATSKKNFFCINVNKNVTKIGISNTIQSVKNDRIGKKFHLHFVV